MDTSVEDWIKLFLKEDVGNGDFSSLSCVPNGAKGKAKLLVKDDGVLAGMDVAEKVFQLVDTNLLFNAILKDGASIAHGDIAFELSGSSQSILKGERLCLNILQRMSGIATQTRHYTELLKGLKTKVLDTRKTTPGFRYFEKKAVEIGGGVNHRFGLYDMIMLKDNHIDYAGGINAAIKACKSYLKVNDLDLKIEVEARNLEEVNEILASEQVDRIMLDNFNFSDMRKAVQLIGSQAETEASGGITESSLRAYAECGVDYISVGALTHQIKSLDLSLKAEMNA